MYSLIAFLGLLLFVGLVCLNRLTDRWYNDGGWDE